MWLFNLMKKTTNPLVRLGHGHTREIYLLVKKKKSQGLLFPTKQQTLAQKQGNVLKRLPFRSFLGGFLQRRSRECPAPAGGGGAEKGSGHFRPSVCLSGALWSPTLRGSPFPADSFGLQVLVYFLLPSSSQSLATTLALPALSS